MEDSRSSRRCSHPEKYPHLCVDNETVQSGKDVFYALYAASHNNAVRLLQDAEILFEKKRFPSAYALSFTALEEIAKSQLAADVYTGFLAGEEFYKICYKHEKKINRMAWATNDAADCLSANGMFMEIEKPTFKARNDAMYVGLEGREVRTPSFSIGREEAESAIHIVNMAIDRIIVTEEMSGRIGTKGFMK